MKSKKVVGICMGAVLAASSLFGMTGCQKDDRDPQILEVYNMYVASAESEGETPMSYEEWLDSIKGPKGDTGAKGEKGETGAKGEDGVGIKDVTVNEDGELVIEYTDGSSKNCGKVVGADGKDGAPGAKGDTGAQGAKGEQGIQGEQGATGEQGIQGEKGETGAQGQRGTKMFTGTKSNGAEISNELQAKGDIKDSIKDLMTGDLYINTETGDLYVYKFEGDEKGGTSSWTVVGNLKGPQGEQGPQGPQGIPGTGTVADPSKVKTVMPDAPAKVSVKELVSATYIVEVNLGVTKLTSGEVLINIGEGMTSRLVFSEERSAAADGDNVYYGYLFVPEGSENANLSATTEGYVTKDIKFTKWEVPTLKADGVEVEIPVYPSTISKDKSSAAGFKIEPGWSGKYCVSSYKFAPGSSFTSTSILILMFGSKMRALQFTDGKYFSMDKTYYDALGADQLIYARPSLAGMKYCEPMTIAISPFEE